MKGRAMGMWIVWLVGMMAVEMLVGIILYGEEP